MALVFPCPVELKDQLVIWLWSYWSVKSLLEEILHWFRIIDWFPKCACHLYPYNDKQNQSTRLTKLCLSGPDHHSQFFSHPEKTLDRHWFSQFQLLIKKRLTFIWLWLIKFVLFQVTSDILHVWIFVPSIHHTCHNMFRGHHSSLLLPSVCWGLYKLQLEKIIGSMVNFIQLIFPIIE